MALAHNHYPPQKNGMSQQFCRSFKLLPAWLGLHRLTKLIWGFPKIVGFSPNWGPQIIHFHRVFHDFHHPFWGTPIFGNIHFGEAKSWWVNQQVLCMLNWPLNLGPGADWTWRWGILGWSYTLPPIIMEKWVPFLNTAIFHLSWWWEKEYLSTWFLGPPSLEEVMFSRYTVVKVDGATQLPKGGVLRKGPL